MVAWLVLLIIWGTFNPAYTIGSENTIIIIIKNKIKMEGRTVDGVVVLNNLLPSSSSLVKRKGWKRRWGRQGWIG